MTTKTATVRRRIETKNLFGKKAKFKRNDEVLVIGKRDDRISGEIFLVCNLEQNTFIELPQNDLVFDDLTETSFVLPPYKHPNMKFNHSDYTTVIHQGKEEIAIGTLQNEDFPEGAYLLYNNTDPRKPVVTAINQNAVEVKHTNSMIHLKTGVAS